MIKPFFCDGMCQCSIKFNKLKAQYNIIFTCSLSDDNYATMTLEEVSVCTIFGLIGISEQRDKSFWTGSLLIKISRTGEGGPRMPARTGAPCSRAACPGRGSCARSTFRMPLPLLLLCAPIVLWLELFSRVQTFFLLCDLDVSAPNMPKRVRKEGGVQLTSVSFLHDTDLILLPTIVLYYYYVY